MEEVNSSFSLDKMSESVNCETTSDVKVREKNIGFLQLFTFASKRDIVLMSIGCISSIAKGPIQFIFGLLMLNLINVFVAGNSSDNHNGLTNNTTSKGTSLDCNQNPQIMYVSIFFFYNNLFKNNRFNFMNNNLDLEIL